MHSLFHAVLFDFDGTLADSYDAITASVNFVRSRHSLPPLEQREVRTKVGNGLWQLLADIVPGGNPEADAKVYLEHHPSVMFSNTRLLPGVKDALAALRSDEVRMAICSNKSVSLTKKLLGPLAISSYFDAALGPEDAGKPKPDPAMIHLALQRLDVPIAKALYVGDMPVDVETARNAGILVWVLPTGSSDRETLMRAKPDRILDSMADLPGAIGL
jgi:phosphoglycolate phosphatase